MLNLPEGFKFVDTENHPVWDGVEPGQEHPLTQPISDFWIKQLSEYYGVEMNNVCCMCGAKIEVQIFKNTGTCTEHCRKLRDNDLQPFRGGALAP